MNGRPRRQWTSDEDNFLKENYPYFGLMYCAKALHLSKDLIRGRIQHLSLKPLPLTERKCRTCNTKFTATGDKDRFCKSCRVRKCKDHYQKTKKEAEKLRRSDVQRLCGRLASVINSRNKNLHNYETWKIDRHFIEALYQKQEGRCYYTGRLMKAKSEIRYDREMFSVDRLDSSKPYTPENVVLCTWGVNKLKNDICESDFFQLCHDVVNTHNKRSVTCTTPDTY